MAKPSKYPVSHLVYIRFVENLQGVIQNFDKNLHREELTICRDIASSFRPKPSFDIFFERMKS